MVERETDVVHDRGFTIPFSLSFDFLLQVQCSHYGIGYSTPHPYERDQLVYRSGSNAKQFGKGSYKFGENYHRFGNIYTNAACSICPIHGFLSRVVRFSPILDYCIYLVVHRPIRRNGIVSAPSYCSSYHFFSCFSTPPLCFRN